LSELLTGPGEFSQYHHTIILSTILLTDMLVSMQQISIIQLEDTAHLIHPCLWILVWK